MADEGPALHVSGGPRRAGLQPGMEALAILEALAARSPAGPRTSIRDAEPVALGAGYRFVLGFVCLAGGHIEPVLSEEVHPAQHE